MLTQPEFFLPANGLKNAAVLAIEPDFEFIVGDKKYPCSSFFAEFISPAVAEIRSKDPSIKSFKIDVEDPNNYFELVIQLMNGNEIEANIPQSVFLRNIGEILQNDEIVDAFSFVNNNHLTTKNVIPTLLEKQQYNINISKETEFIAKHFFSIDEDELMLLDKETLLHILSNKILIITNEDSLYQFITKLIDRKGPEYTDFLNYVRYENISFDNAQSFLKYLTIDVIRKNPDVWKSLQKRMLLPSESFELNMNRYIHCEIQIPYHSDPFQGIFSFMTKILGKNPIEAKMVEVTQLYNECTIPPSALIDYKQQQAKWYLSEYENSWICFDFKNAKVAMNAYSISSGKDSSYWEYPVSFTWEGSQDGKSWTDIDVKDLNTEMGGNEMTHTWFLHETSPLYRYIRFRLRDVTRRGGLYTRRMELFGLFRLPKNMREVYERNKYKVMEEMYGKLDPKDMKDRNDKKKPSFY